MELSTIIINWNTRELLLEALASLAEFHPAAEGSHEIIVIDNASTDGSAEAVARNFPEVKLVINPENIGFGRAVNQGIDAATGEFLFLLNSDARLISDSPKALIDFLRSNPKAGIAGARLIFPDDKPQISYGDFPSPWAFICSHYKLKKILPPRFIPKLGRMPDSLQKEPMPVDYVSGAAFMLRRKVVAKVGGFDPGYKLYFEETDLCFRANKAGWGIYLVPDATVVHHWGKSLLNRTDEDRIRAKLLFQESELRFYARNYSRPIAWLIKLNLLWHHGRHYISRKIGGKIEKARWSLAFYKLLRSIKIRAIK